MSKRLLYLFTLICTISLFTACGDDDKDDDGGGGNGEVDTTWEQVAGSYEGEKLAFSYGETPLTGKTATFTATNSTNCSLALTNVIPGEDATTISDIKVENSAFSGSATTTNANVEYTGSVKDDVMTLKLNVVMKDPNGWAKGYRMADYTTGELTYNDYTNPNAVIAGAGYFNYVCDTGFSDFGTSYGVMFRGVFGVLLPQVLNTVTLNSDGNITANFMKGPKIQFEPMWAMQAPTADVVTGLIPASGWQQSPEHLAYWFEKDGKLMVKLNIGAIISQTMGGGEAGALEGIINQILTSDPATLKTLLAGLLKVPAIPVSDETIAMIQSWAVNGVPMTVKTVDGHTYMYLDKETFDPIMGANSSGTSDIMAIWNMLGDAGIIPEQAQMAGMLISGIANNWESAEAFDLGLDLVAE